MDTSKNGQRTLFPCHKYIKHLFEADISTITFASKREMEDKSSKIGLQCAFTLYFMSYVYDAF